MSSSPKGRDESTENQVDGFASFFGVVVGVAIGTVACWLAIVLAGGGHGSYLAAKILFPFTMLSTHWLDEITMPFVFLAIAQFPFYGWIAIRTIFIPKWRIVAGCLLGSHLIAVGVLLAFPPVGFS